MRQVVVVVVDHGAKGGRRGSAPRTRPTRAKYMYCKFLYHAVYGGRQVLPLEQGQHVPLALMLLLLLWLIMELREAAVGNTPYYVQGQHGQLALQVVVVVVDHWAKGGRRGSAPRTRPTQAKYMHSKFFYIMQSMEAARYYP